MKNIVYLTTLKPTSHRTAEESLGIEYLASVLEKNGYQVKIRDLWLDESVTTDILYQEILSDKEKVLFVGTSSYMLNNQPTCDLIKKLKNQNINVACGGYGPTFEPEMFLNAGADVIMVGEGENSIVEVASAFKDEREIGEVKSVIYMKDGKLISTPKRELITNLDSIPFPKRPYLKLTKERHSTVNVSSSRGCMGHCSFCSIAAFGNKQIGKRWRGRSLENIVEELKQLSEKGVKTVKFIDDSFLEKERDEQWCKGFLKAINQNGLKMSFRASLRADKITFESMKFLQEAGFFSYSVGIENGSKSALARMHKLASVQDNLRAIKIFKDLGLYMQAGFILFDDQTTMQELKENYQFMKEHIELVSKGIFSEMYAAVGTEFTENTIKEDGEKLYSNNIYQVKDDKARQVYTNLKRWQKHHSQIYDMVIDPISAPKDIPVEEMRKYHKLMIIMKEIDLEFMKDTINCVEKGEDIDDVFYCYQMRYNEIFDKISKLANEYYEKDGIKYDGDVNGFLNSNIQ